MSDHAKLSASGSARWIACPGSVWACAGLPDTSGPAAQLGTATHSLIEMALVEKKGAEAYEGVAIVNKDGSKFIVDDEMIRCASVFLGIVGDLVDAAGPGGTLITESRVDLSWLHKGLFGTLDAAILDRTNETLHVLDYKNGQGAVDALWNTQLLYYALGAAHGVPEGVIEDVAMHIVQPNGRNETHQEWALPLAAVRAWGVEVLKPAAVQADDPRAPLHAGPHCRYCQAKNAGACPEACRYLGEVTRTEFLCPELPKVEELPTADLLKAVEALELMTTWAKEGKAILHRRAESGEKIPGWKLVQNIGNRQWTEEAAGRLESYLGEEEIYNRKIRGLGEIEKALKGKELKGPEVREIMDTITERPDKGTALVSVSDKRPEIVMLGAEMLECADVFQ